MSTNKKTEKQRSKEGVVFSEEQLPEGFEPIGHLDKENKALHSFIIRQCDADLVTRYRINKGTGHGRLYLHRETIARLSEEWQGRARSSASCDLGISSIQNEAAVTALCEINNQLAVIGDTLRDLVAAVQLLGEQQSKQHEPVGTWRDMNGEAL